MSIKEIRNEMGKTQIDMAKLIGVPLSTYRLWEYGAATPNEENTKKLEDVLADYKFIAKTEAVTE